MKVKCGMNGMNSLFSYSNFIYTQCIHTIHTYIYRCGEAVSYSVNYDPVIIHHPLETKYL